jgi:predicted N-formylglutamate amidohydrolase
VRAVRPRVLLLTCEHGGARVPARYRKLFQSQGARRALQDHRGSDLGALSVARSLQRELEAPLFASTVTRLLVDLNRSIGHPSLFSEYSKRLGPVERASVLDRHYFPHRRAVESWIEDKTRGGHQVVHVGVHSFAPQIDRRVRTADVGILYDPSRPTERVFCREWKTRLEATSPTLRVRRNYPFLGRADGLVTHLRSMFDAKRYLGIELETNQALLETPRGRRQATSALGDSLRATLGAP